jgi:arginine/lysine/histidine transport system permease protein
VLVAIIRYSYDKNHTNKAGNFIQSLLQFLLAVANGICHVYLTIIRGVPVVVQLMIIYFIIFASPDVSKIFCAVVAFSLNSGAYVAEIVRGGLNSVDKGQFEAGRSLGFGYIATMWYIILPQAFKNILPALGNEAIMLLKDTSISGYVAIQDLTKGGDIIRSRTYDAFMPLIAVALIYLILVTILTLLLRRLERRLQSSER